VNLPNAITAARIAVAPVVAWLVILPSWPLRLAAWALYVAAAVTEIAVLGAELSGPQEG